MVSNSAQVPQDARHSPNLGWQGSSSPQSPYIDISDLQRTYNELIKSEPSVLTDIYGMLLHTIVIAQSDNDKLRDEVMSMSNTPDWSSDKPLNKS